MVNSKLGKQYSSLSRYFTLCTVQLTHTNQSKFKMRLYTDPIVLSRDFYFLYLVVLQPRLRSHRLVLMSPIGRHRNTRNLLAVAGHYSGRAGSDRNAQPPGTPPWLFSCGASSSPHIPLPLPAHREDAAGNESTG